MRMSLKRSVLIFGSACVLFGAAQQADAAGFGIREQNIRANGLSQAYTAIVDDPSAVYYNPGAVGFLRGIQNSFGVTIFRARFDYDSQFTANDADIRTRYLAVPHGFFSVGLSDKFLDENDDNVVDHWYERLTFAFGVYAPYGLSLEWPADAETRYSNIRTSIRAVHYTPVVGIKLTDWLSIGGGFSYVNSRRNVPSFVDKQGREGVRIIRKVDTADAIFNALRPQLPQTVPDAAVRTQARNIAGTAPEPVLRLKTDGDGFGYTFGFQVRSPNFNKADAGDVKGFFGFAYRSEVNIASQGGDVEFQNVQDPVGLPPGTFTNTFIRGGIRANLTLPSNFDIGAGVRLYDRLTLAFDAKWQGWNSFDRIDIRFVTGSPASVQRLDTKWRDVWSFNFGAEYLAFGSYYDKPLASTRVARLRRLFLMRRVRRLSSTFQGDEPRASMRSPAPEAFARKPCGRATVPICTNTRRELFSGRSSRATARTAAYGFSASSSTADKLSSPIAPQAPWAFGASRVHRPRP